MTRPRLRRMVRGVPGVSYFKPAGVPMAQLEEAILNVDEFEARVFANDIVAKVGYETIDESKLAYKDPFAVIEAQNELVDVIHHVTPLINIKA